MRGSLVASILVGAVAVVAPASADDGKAAVAVSYAFTTYLEEGAGSAPFGVGVSAATAPGSSGFEVDVAYHRDSEEGIVLNTVTIGLGPRWGQESGNASPFLHALGLFRHDSALDSSNSSFGGMVGGGVDLGRSGRARFRLGGDLQIVFDEGENFKTLRVTAGVRF